MAFLETMLNFDKKPPLPTMITLGLVATSCCLCEEYQHALENKLAQNSILAKAWQTFFKIFKEARDKSDSGEIDATLNKLKDLLKPR